MSMPMLRFSGLSAIFLMGLFLPSFAQEAPSPCAPDCQARIELKRQEAEQLEEQKNYAAASEKYASIIPEEPQSIASQTAAIKAGQCLELAGRFVDAVPFYDTAISIANTRSSETSFTKSEWLKGNKRYALFQRGRAFEQAGQQESASQAYQHAIETSLTDLAAEPAPSLTMKQEKAIVMQGAAAQLGQYLEQYGIPAQAVTAYDRVIAIADARADTADGENAMTILTAKCRALIKKADLCQRADRGNDCREAIRRLREEFPLMFETAQAAVVEAKLENRSTQQAELAVANEDKAIVLLNKALRAVDENVYGMNAVRGVQCSAGDDGTMSVRVKIRGLGGDKNFWNLWVSDPAGKSLGRWYGAGTLVRGRIGSTNLVTPKSVFLTGRWDELEIRVLAATNQTSFYFNGKHISTLSHHEVGAGDVIGSIRIERIENSEASGSFIDFDDLMVTSGSAGEVCISEEFTYADGPLNGRAGWSGDAAEEIFVSGGVLRIFGGQFKNAFGLIDQLIAAYPETSAATYALEKKAQLFARLHHFEEAKSTFETVLNRLRATASRSEFFQSVRVRLKQLVLHHYIDETRAGRPASDQEWEQIRVLLREIQTQDTRPDERAQMYVSIAVTYCAQKRYAEALASVQTFLSTHDTQQFPMPTVLAHYYAAAALQGMNRPSEALDHLNTILYRGDVGPRMPLGAMFSSIMGRLETSLKLAGFSEAEAQLHVAEWKQFYDPNK